MLLLAVAALVTSVFINMQANMPAGARQVNMGILFTNHKLPSIHSESAQRNRSKANTYSYAEKICRLQMLFLLGVKSTILTSGNRLVHNYV